MLSPTVVGCDNLLGFVLVHCYYSNISFDFTIVFGKSIDQKD